MPFDPTSFVRHSPDLTFAAVVSKSHFLWISITPGFTVDCRTIGLPSACHDFAISQSAVIGLFDSGRGGIRSVVKWNQREWEDPVDVPLVTHLCGGSRFWFAASHQYVLVLHELPDLFEFFASGVPPIRTLLGRTPADRQREMGGILPLFYGVEAIANAEGLDRFPHLIAALLDELWAREMFGQWSALALRAPALLQSQQCALCIRELLTRCDIGPASLVSFAQILEATGDAAEAFKLYLKAKNGKGVADLLSAAVDCVNSQLSEVVELLMTLMKTGDRQCVIAILKGLSDHHVIVKPMGLIPRLMADWALVELYYQSFKQPPQSVVNAYVIALAIYRKGKLQEFLNTNREYDWKVVSESLLKLGCLSEYASLLQRFDIQKYFEFLVVSEDWSQLFESLMRNRRHWPFVMRMMLFDEDYFFEFSNHFNELGITLSEILAEIPSGCPVPILLRGFRYIATILSATTAAENIADGIYKKQAGDVFSKVMQQRNRPLPLKF
jgi:hypothetical protein